MRMSRLIRCDKCGKESIDGIKMYTVQIRICKNITDLGATDAYFDICSECNEKLKDEYIGGKINAEQP